MVVLSCSTFFVPISAALEVSVPTIGLKVGRHFGGAR
jgi:hypothetical protein